MKSRAASKGSGLFYPFDTVPGTGQTVEVAPGVLWIRMPMPGVLSHINVWAIEDGGEWVVVDTGLRTPETVAAWCQLMSGPMGGRRVSRVFVTHMHPDHIGMAGWITRKFNCHLWMTRLEYLTCRVLAADSGREAPQDAVDFYRGAGWQDAAMESYRARFGNFGKNVYALPDSYRRLQDGERVVIGSNQWEVVVGHGHSPEHACLYCPDLGLLISGDQVLPRISSNVSVYPIEPDADPASDWMDSLSKMKNLVSDDVLVLPAHNEPFRGLHARLDQLRRSQEVALERLREALSEPKRTVDLFGSLFASKVYSDPMQLTLATGETVACLNYLVARGKAIRDTDAGGVFWYRAA